MTWEELCEKAKALGYRIEEDEIWDADTGLHFTKKGVFYYWSIDDETIFALDRTYDQMYQIILALQ